MTSLTFSWSYVSILFFLVSTEVVTMDYAWCTARRTDQDILTPDTHIYTYDHGGRGYDKFPPDT